MDIYDEWLKQKGNLSQRAFAREMVAQGLATSVTRVRMYLYERGRSERLIVEPPPKKIIKSPKILLYDLETTPLICYTWGLYDQNISPENIIQDWFIISWTAKWFGEPEVMGEILTSQEVHERNDSRIVPKLWALMEEADVLVAHNGKKFDFKRARTRFIYHGLKPTLHAKEVDTLTTARSVFNFTSNKLDYLNKVLKITRKQEHRPRLWYDAYQGDPEALKEMFEYNKVDTLALEDLYVVLRPWMTNHPNVAVYMEEEVEKCCKCGSKDLHWHDKGYTTFTGFYLTWRCEKCGAVGRSRENTLTKEKKETLLR